MARFIGSVGDRLLKLVVPQVTAAASIYCTPPRGGSCWGGCCSQPRLRMYCWWNSPYDYSCECRFQGGGIC